MAWETIKIIELDDFDGLAKYRSAQIKICKGASHKGKLVKQHLNGITDNFYPDFVALLEDGRVLVVEYKGEDRETNDDSKEKRNIGELWEERSADKKALFLMAVQEDETGRNVYQQIDAKIEKKL